MTGKMLKKYSMRSFVEAEGCPVSSGRDRKGGKPRLHG